MFVCVDLLEDKCSRQFVELVQSQAKYLTVQLNVSHNHLRLKPKHA